MEETSFTLRKIVRLVATALLSLVLLWRIIAMIVALRSDDPSPLLAFPFSAVLPALLLIGLTIMPPTTTREGLLMRVGAMIQLWLIILLPSLALHLALGFPVVFLVVEIFETRVSRRIRDPLVRLVIA